MRFTALEHEGFSFFSVQIWDPRISGEKIQTESKTPRRCKSLLRTLVFVFFLRLFVGGGSEGGGVLFVFIVFIVFIVFVLFGWFSVKCRMDTRVQICCFLFRANGNSISASEAALKPLKMLEYLFDVGIPLYLNPRRRPQNALLSSTGFHEMSPGFPTPLVSFSVTLTLTGLEGLALPWQVYTATGSKSINGISAMNDGNPKEMKCPTFFPSFGRDYII